MFMFSNVLLCALYCNLKDQPFSVCNNSDLIMIEQYFIDKENYYIDVCAVIIAVTTFAYFSAFAPL